LILIDELSLAGAGEKGDESNIELVCFL